MSQPDEDFLELGISTQMPVASSEPDAADTQRNTLTQYFMQSSSLSSPASTDMICTRDEAVSSFYGLSMPSTAVAPSDPMEQIQAQERRNYALEELQRITTLLRTLSFFISGTRLAIHFHPLDEKSIVRTSGIAHTEQLADETEILCVAQSPADVDYSMEIHFQTPPRHSKITSLRCQIVYDPASDNCILINRTKGYLNLVHLQHSIYSRLLTPDKPCAIEPGLWGIAISLSGDSVDDCIVKFLLRERRHTISITQPNGQRNHWITTKRHALDANSPVDLATPFPSSMRDSEPKSRSLTGVTANPLLELQDGDFANIQAPLPNRFFRQDVSTYQLKRFRKLSPEGVAGVFACRHSILGDLAVKVIQYQDKSLSGLVRCSELWKREKGFLEKLKHVGFILFFFCNLCESI